MEERNTRTLERLTIDHTGNVLLSESGPNILEGVVLYCGAPYVVAVASPDDLHVEVERIWKRHTESRANAYCANEIGLTVQRDGQDVGIYAVQFYKIEEKKG
jgi:hypothetical protein